MEKPHMVEQVIKFSDGTETVIKYRGVIENGELIPDEVTEEAIEEAIVEPAEESVEEAVETAEEAVAESVEDEA